MQIWFYNVKHTVRFDGTYYRLYISYGIEFLFLAETL